MNKRCVSCMTPLNGFDVCPSCGRVQSHECNDLSYLPMGYILTNRYFVGKCIGFGGFGITYVAWDEALQQKVAIKEYYPSGLVSRVPGDVDVVVFSGSKKDQYLAGLSRFLAEARNMVKFSNEPNIVNVIDYFEANNTAYIVMEYLDGITLKEYLKQLGGSISYEVALQIIRPVCAALAKMHEQGIVHRDVSPDNIFITTQNAIKLIDFGAARLAKGEKEETLSVILKPGYAPPEQYRTKSKQGSFTDVYAVGACMYRMITGHMPPESVDREIEDDMAMPSAFNKDIPEKVDRAIARAMALDSSVRFKTTDEFINALTGGQYARFPHEEIKKRKSRNLLIAALSGVAVVAICAVAFLSMFKRSTVNPEKLTVWVPEYGIEIMDSAMRSIFAVPNSEGSVDEDTAAPDNSESILESDGIGYGNLDDSIVVEFLNEYTGMEVTVKYIPADEYIQRLEAAAAEGKMPDLFTLSIYDVGALNSLSPDKSKPYYASDKLFARCADISDTVDTLIKSGYLDDYNFIDEYNKYFPSGKMLPTGVRIPVMYVNSRTTAAADGREALCMEKAADIETLSGIMGDYSWIIPEYMQNPISYCISSRYDGLDIELIKMHTGIPDGFADGSLDMYIGYNTDLKWVQNSLGAAYSVYACVGENYAAEFTGYWAVGNNESDNRSKAAALLMVKLINKNTQRILSNATSCLPLQKEIRNEMIDNIGMAFSFIEDKDKFMNNLIICNN